jgi:hypothetical protein
MFRPAFQRVYFWRLFQSARMPEMRWYAEKKAQFYLQ